MKKKMMALLLALCMILALACGCSNSTTTAAEAEQTAESTAAQPAEEQSAAEPTAEETTQEPADEPVQESVQEAAETVEEESAEIAADDGSSLAGIPGEGFHFLNSADPSVYPLEEGTSFSVYTYFQNQSGLVNAYEEYPVWEELEAATGVTLEWVTVSRDAYDQQFQLFIAAGDYTDMFYKFNYSGGNGLAYDDEVIIRLNDLIDDSMPNYSHAMQWDASIREDSTETDGSIYQIVPIVEYEALASGWTVRQDYLDQVGLDVPLTLDDLTEVLTAFRDQLGMGSALMLNEDTYESCFASAYDTYAGFYFADGEARYGFAEDSYREFLTQMADWYQQGFIDQDFMNITGNSRDSFTINLIASGDTGVFKSETRMWENYLDLAPESVYTALPTILKDENSLSHFFDEKSHIGNGGTVISTACEDPELLATYLDYMYTKEGSVTMDYGVEGKSYYYDENGEPQYDGEFLYNFIDENELTSTNAAGAQYWYPQNDWISFRFYISADKDWVETTDMAVEAVNTWNDRTYFSDDNWGTTSVSLTTEEQEEVQNLQTDLETYVDEHIAKFIIGAESLDTDWDTFVATMYDKFELDRLLEIQQDAYDRQYGE